MTRHEIRGDARGRQHAIVRHREPVAAQLRGLLRRRIGAAIGQDDKRHPATREFRQYIDRTRQDVVTAQRAVAQQQRAVQVEHEPLDAGERPGRGRGDLACHAVRDPFN